MTPGSGDSRTVRADLLRGHLDGFVLASLEDHPRHGYAIAEEITRRGDARLDVPSGTLYPALHRLERAGWITSEWSVVDGRRRRTYSLTSSGRRELARQRRRWTDLSRTVAAALGT